VSENQAEFKGWARVEVMGHQTHIGYVTTEAYGAAVMFRVDRPEIPEEEITLTEREWTNSGYLPAGAVVKRGKIDAVSVLVGAGSIYRIVPCTEGVALKAIRESERRPLSLVKLPETMAIAGAAGDTEFDDDDEAGEDLIPE
jgi:hypothetical protein